MTELEKKLNRVDLAAYKNYDNKMYSLVPGINSEFLHEDQLSVASKYPKKSAAIDQTVVALSQQEE
jgi:hypothetical protein